MRGVFTRGAGQNELLRTGADTFCGPAEEAQVGTPGIGAGVGHAVVAALGVKGARINSERSGKVNLTTKST